MRGHALTWVLLLAVGAVAAYVEVTRGFIDLDVYRFGGVALADGAGLYDGADPATGLPFTYPPFAAGLMAPVAQLPPVLLAAGWAAASVAALLAVLRLLLPRRHPHAVLALTAGCLLLEPVWQSLSFGQVNLFLMLLVAYDVLRPDRRTAGVLIGVAAGIKLTPLVLVALLVLAGRRVPAVRAVAAFVGTVALGFLLAAGDSATYWTHTLWDPARIGGLSFTSNQSVNGVLVRMLGREAPTPLWLVVAGALSGALLVLGALWWRRGQADLALLLGALAMLLASPVSWSHHWVWAAPAVVVLWRRSRRIAVAWTALFASACIWWPPHREDRELGWGPLDHLVGNAYVWAALLLGGWAAASYVRAGSTRPRTSPSDSRPPLVEGAV
ncbi:glycosyltransferase 87 family protein [Nocardioides sp. W7]|uniref:glycosyltransferase 87 family protein n=1 Tax=Nocardioides sp. W7 TaxID=2931390 RepID=UPI001FD5AA54|nr:glycosyltransferase 87 family protein [Nocardioides sp. W7]